jgi:hypothetical protein
MERAMTPRFAFPTYIFTTTFYGAIGLAGVVFAIFAILHLLTGYFIWGFVMGLFVAMPFAIVGGLSGLIASIINSVFMFRFSTPEHQGRNYVRIATSITVLLLSPIIALYVFLRHYTFYSATTGEANLGFVIFQTIFVTVGMIVAHHYALPRLFTTSRKRKEKAT